MFTGRYGNVFAANPRWNAIKTAEVLQNVAASMTAAAEGADSEALHALLQRHQEALYRFCCHLTGNANDAEDICQETLARAITRVDSLQAGAAFRGWLFTIARNCDSRAARHRPGRVRRQRRPPGG